MSKTKKSLSAVLLIIVFLVVPLNWYKARYSMKHTEPFNVLVDNARFQLLIASQGSEFKDAVVAGIVRRLQGRPVSINVIDVSGLPSVDPQAWDAVVILHTWEQWQPPATVAQFIDQAATGVIDKTIVLTTSGNGESAMEGVDAITSASIVTDVPRNVSAILQRVNELFARQQSQGGQEG